MTGITAAFGASLLVLSGAPANSAVPGDQSYQFQIARAAGTLYNPWTKSDDRVELRSFRGSGAKDGDFVAPTLRIAPGKTLTVDIDNRLEPCTAQQVKDHRCYNDTNLHTHGLWVSPSGNSDNVLLSIPPGETFRYRYKISDDHPAGTFWYHPHRHGSGFVQVGSGMAGALIVTGDRKPTATSPGDIDILLKDERNRPFAERVMLFQQIQYGCLDETGKIEGRMEKQEVEPGIEEEVYVRPWTCAAGRVGRIESPDHDYNWVQSGRFTGINGKVQPVLAPMRAGTFERWRLIHAGTRERIRMHIRRLDDRAPNLRDVAGADQEQWIKNHCVGPALPIWQIAMDGLTRSGVYRSDVAVLFSGDRMDVLVNLPSRGRYCLLQDATIGRSDSQPPRALAMLEATGRGSPNADADAQLVETTVRAAKRAIGGSDDTQVRNSVIADLRDGMKLSSFVWHKSVPKEEVTAYREALVNILEPPDTNGPVLFHINGRAYEHDRIDMMLPLGATEEWFVTSLLAGHPLHIHVNPFQIVGIRDGKGQDVTDAKGPAYDPDYAGLLNEWKDTVFVKEGHRVAFRTRYERFTGDFVTHCHIMYHGDHGMMLNLRIYDPKQPQTASATHH